ncbi:MAG TPA: histidine--tRNA ligase [Candidatus Paceibacterota bacterium]|nr:histidine--tRNA ligase [Candidatus Paceibacterota bacterium]
MADFPKRLLEDISGFPTLGPAEAIAQERMLAVIRKHFAAAGYAPLETPLVERPEVLAAKNEGEIANQIYGLRLLNPEEGASDEKDLALRFDHTVPLARYVATHARELPFPFRRSAIGKVLRGERAKDGRYREFLQADIDAVGHGALSLLHDAEMVAVIAGIFAELDFGPFTVRINNRKVLAAIIRHMGGEDAAMPELMRAIDRLEKAGKEKTALALVAHGMQQERAKELLEFLPAKRSAVETLAFLEGAGLDDEGKEGLAELKEVIKGVESMGVPPERYTIDLSIARGLSYYTGSVFETALDEHPDLGSIASGGRYDGLASAYTKEAYPGVGISIGVSRLLARLIKAGIVEAKAQTPAKVLVTTAERERLAEYLNYAKELRAAGVAAEIYLEEKPLDKQLAFANKKGFPYALIAMQEHFAKGVVVLRDLATGEQKELPPAELARALG